MMIDSAAISRLSVLQVIRRKGPISRVEVAELLDLSKATVTLIAAELIEAGFVEETVSALRERGRPRVLLGIKSSSFAVVSATVDLFGFLELNLVSLSGDLLQSARVRREKPPTVRDFMLEIAGAIELFIAAMPSTLPRIACVAISIPGIVESSTGLLHWLASYPEVEFPAAKIMSDQLGLPVIIENNIDCLARAEHWFGEGPAAGDFTIVYQGLSIGLAQYAGGVPRTGVAGVNSEFGHVKTDYSKDARACFCGARGCLTTYSSLTGVVASNAPGTNGVLPDVEKVMRDSAAKLEAAVSGDQDAIAAFAAVGRHLGIALANYINIFDPGLVLIKSADKRMAALIKRELHAALAENTIPALLRRTIVDVAAEMSDWQWKGTAALALEQAYLGKAVRKMRDTGKIRSGIA